MPCRRAVRLLGYERADGLRLRYAVVAGRLKRTTIAARSSSFPAASNSLKNTFETIGELRERGFAVAVPRCARPGIVEPRTRQSLERPCRRLFKTLCGRCPYAFVGDVVAAAAAAAFDVARPFHGRSDFPHVISTTIPVSFNARAVFSAPMTGIKLPLVAPFVASWLARLAVTLGASYGSCPFERSGNRSKRRSTETW